MSRNLKLELQLVDHPDFEWLPGMVYEYSGGFQYIGGTEQTRMYPFDEVKRFNGWPLLTDMATAGCLIEILCKKDVIFNLGFINNMWAIIVYDGGENGADLEFEDPVLGIVLAKAIINSKK